MWKLRGCPKCGGDLYIDKDMDDNWLAQCLQCAYQRELRNIKEAQHSEHEKLKEAVGAKK